MVKTVKIKNRKVTLKNFLGDGCQRDVYNCDYKKDGKSYVVKKAKNISGIRANTFEHNFYNTLKKRGSKHAKLFPDFAGMSACGRFVLVEKCKTAFDTHRIIDCPEASDVFPNRFLHDDHNENWGYTLKGKRAVIMDMGYCVSQFRAMRRAAGLTRIKFETLMKRKQKK